MANKGNQSLGIDRELVESTWGLTMAMASALEEQVPVVKQNANYLANEENVGGSVAKNFREQNESVAVICDEILNKTSTVAVTMRKLSEAAGSSFTATIKSTEESRNQLNAVLSKAKNVGKG